MLMLISPAKTLDFETPLPTARFTQPAFLDQSAPLVDILKRKSPQDIAQLMSLSDKLAWLNAERYSQWAPPFHPGNARPALFAFMGDVYEGLNAYALTDTQLDYAQQHLGILSGLYGLLHPLDLIQPYRLEMGTKLPNPAGKDLYAYWKKRLTAVVNQRLEKARVLVNLASDEYFKAIDAKALTGKLIQPVFQDEKNGQYKIISFYAKRARGLMARYAMNHGLQDAEQLKRFDSEGYRFEAGLSDDKHWVFRRPEVRAQRA
ncbi:peroxide stress protein YaaA [Leeia oryzae]|uniref:peroxide stress protein YaaA n=1 Tax=Leeia oryzae TaxID=356662 RepID=UPI0003714DE6|nr:peroxide stress protein YaaA [Leeia oryzae]